LHLCNTFSDNIIKKQYFYRKFTKDMNVKKWLFLVLIVATHVANAQTKGKYLVLFKDKLNNTYSTAKPLEFLSQRSLDRRKRSNVSISNLDLPPSKTYIDQLKQAGATVWYTSRWLNAALVVADSATAKKIEALAFVKGFENNGPLNLNGSGNLRRRSKFEIEAQNSHEDTLLYGTAKTQTQMLGLHNLHNIQHRGQNMLIAVLDDGFNRIHENKHLKHLFDNKWIADTHDFVRNTNIVYDIGGHGNLVLGTMAAYAPGTIVGTAPWASYALFRTEDASTEKIIEEANYLFACEKADSLGADLINTSLGYTDYDYPGYSHTYADMNGDRTLCTRAADWAAQAGILVCISAGNSGTSKAWPYIGAPADGDSVLAIGAVTANKIKVGFSSIGPSADGRIKPDLVAMGQAAITTTVNANGQTVLASVSGTSFSSPIFCGFAACYWQLYPQKSMMTIRQELLALGAQAATPDNLLGWVYRFWAI
jgi:serine protease AprX